MKKYFLFLVIFTTFISSCKKDTALVTISGKVVAPNVSKVIKGATIEVLNNSSYRTKSKIDGTFELNVPNGKSTIKVYTGEGDIFVTTVDVDLTTNKDLGNVVLRATQKIGFVFGDFDNLQSIFRDELGYQCDSLTQDDVLDINQLKKYKLILFNCGDFPLITINSTSDFEIIQNNINQYINQGGNGIFTDFGISYIAKVDSMEDLNYNYRYSLLDTTKLTSTLTGETGTENTNVVNTDLINLLGKNNIDIQYNLPSYAIINKRSSFDAEMLLENHLGPVSFAKKIGAGKILYSNFHNEANLSNDERTILEWFLLHF